VKQQAPVPIIAVASLDGFARRRQLFDADRAKIAAELHFPVPAAARIGF
jgi:hypothetical protein